MSVTLKNISLGFREINPEMTEEQKDDVYNENLKLLIENLRIIDYNINEVNDSV